MELLWIDFILVENTQRTAEVMLDGAMNKAFTASSRLSSGAVDLPPVANF